MNLPLLRILGLTNSTRSASFNRMAMETASQLMPPSMRLEPHDLSAIPFYEHNAEHAPVPTAVQVFERALVNSDGLLIACPEYNHSIPARIKNALDWVSRLPSQPMENMPVMILSAATGPLGGARVQYELRRVLDAVGAATLIKPEIFIGMAEKKFDASGRCIDSQTMTLMRGQLNAFQKWILVVNQRTEPSHDGVGLQQA